MRSTTPSNAIASRLSGGPSCGDAIRNGSEECDAADFGGVTCGDLGYTLGGTLACTASCQYDTTGCASQTFPATGQATCWNSAGSVIACGGTGQDGDVQAGATLAYVDNGDGTVTDINTGLMWEKLSDDGSIHDKDNAYTWDEAFSVHVAGLNGGAGFAGHTDWRVPNSRELQSIVNSAEYDPAVSPAFDTGCLVAGCTVLTCSCTASTNYWTSTTYANFPSIQYGVSAWVVLFNDGQVFPDNKAGARRVRAVRGPL